MVFKLFTQRIPYQSYDHPHFFEQQYDELNLTDMSIIYQCCTIWENRILLLYYKMNSIYPFLLLTWESVKGTNLIISTQELMVISVMLGISLYFVLDDYTAFPKHHSVSSCEGYQAKVECEADLAKDEVPVDTVLCAAAKQSLMLHRYHNSSHRSKRNLPDEYYFLRHKRFRYSIEDVDTLGIEDCSNHVDKYQSTGSPYLSMICLVLGVTYLIEID